MAEPFDRLRRFLSELKRRNVYRVAVTYMVASFVVLQLADLAASAFAFPGWFEPMVWVVAGLGFPLALVLAWAFERTPEGVRRETPEGGRPATGSSMGRGTWAAGVLVLVALGAGLWYLLGNAGAPSPNASGTATGTAGAEASAATEDGSSTNLPSGASEARPRVAVLPFRSIPDTGNTGFTRGMTEEVWTQLSKIASLEIVGLRAASRYDSGTDMTAGEIGAELGGLDAVVGGSVQRAGGQLRIRARLTDAETERSLWGEAYEREYTTDEVFRIQADVAQQITDALQRELTEGERRRIRSAPTTNMDAYEAYLQGRSHWFQNWATGDFEEIDRALQRLRTAVRLDSTFAEAYAWLGLAHAQSALPWSDRQARFDSAEAAVRRAQALDPDLAEAYLAEGYLHGLRDSLSARVAALRRALELQPSHAFAKAELSDALESQGHYVKAVRVAREAVRLAPRNPVVLQELGDQLRAVGLYDAAEAWDRYALEIEPGHFQPTAGITETLRLRGDPATALDLWESFRSSRRGSPLVPVLLDMSEVALQAGRPQRARALLQAFRESLRRPSSEGGSESGLAALPQRYRDLRGLTELRLGNRERGRRLLGEWADSARAELERSAAPSPWVHFELAMALAPTGRSDAALRRLERWAESLEGWEVDALLSSPFLDEVRSEPRFQAVLRHMEEEQRSVREEILRLDLDLFPGGGPSGEST